MITSMIFFPEKTLYEKPADYGFVHEEVELHTVDQARLHGWWIKTSAASSGGAVLFLHGNAGNISNRLYKIKGWVDNGFDVLLLDYRGYGNSGGKIERQEDVVCDAHAGLDWIRDVKKVPAAKMVFYGESLGTYPAIRLGTETKAAAVVLEAPFTSFIELGRVHYPLVPAALLRSFAFANNKYISALKTPLFILHGTQDEICPYNMAGELFEQAPEPKGFLSIRGGTHNDLPMAAGEDFWKKPLEFVKKYIE